MFAGRVFFYVYPTLASQESSDAVCGLFCFVDQYNVLMSSVLSQHCCPQRCPTGQYPRDIFTHWRPRLMPFLLWSSLRWACPTCQEAMLQKHTTESHCLIKMIIYWNLYRQTCQWKSPTSEQSVSQNYYYLDTGTLTTGAGCDSQSVHNDIDQTLTVGHSLKDRLLILNKAEMHKNVTRNNRTGHLSALKLH